MIIFKHIKKNKQTILIIFLFWLFATLVRSYAVSNYNFPFWFDLGRDAIVSKEIIEKKDFKIQGPSASGTNDTIYHGVLFYYLIGPLYTFLKDPQLVMYAVIAFSSLSIIPLYLLTQSVTKNKTVTLLVGIFYVFSHALFKSSTWLSNPIIATVSLPFFFYLYWLIFFEGKRKLLPWLLLALAATHQAGILYAPWWGLVFVGFLLEYNQNNLKKWNLKTVLVSLFVYLAGVGTMILTQLKLLRAGIFTLSSLSDFSSMEYQGSKTVIASVLGQYYSKIIDSLYPSLPVLSLLGVVGLFLFMKKTADKKVKTFLAILFASPLLLLSWHNRIAYHSFITLEYLVFLALAMFVVHLWSNRAGKVVAILLVTIFIRSNISEYKSATERKIGEYFVPQGTYLVDQLAAIDYTYQEANGAEFSISTMTNPYQYNTLYSYLYSWYGQKKYGYLPKWYGANQTGMFGGDLLEKTEQPKAIHFSIREPNQGIPDHLYIWFNTEQEGIATPSAKLLFGTLDVQKHLR